MLAARSLLALMLCLGASAASATPDPLLDN